MSGSQELIVAMLRATLFTSIAVLVASVLNARLRAASPRFQRVAWTLAIAQGWLLFPLTLQIERAAEIESPVVLMPIEVTAGDASGIDLSDQLVGNSNITVAPAGWFAWKKLAPAIAIAWIAGAALSILSRVARYIRFVRKLPRTSGFLSDEASWRAEWAGQLSATQIRRPVEMRMTSDLGPLVCYVPFLYLVLAPRVLWQSLTRPEREAILQHELAHLSRGDIWKSLAVRLLALPQWFNPLVWRAVRRFDEAGEWACDDRAAQVGNDGQLHLAKSLIRAAEFVSAGVPATASAQGGVLSRRIRRLVTPQTTEGSTMKKLTFLLVLATLVLVQTIRVEFVKAAPQAAEQGSPDANLPAADEPTAPIVHHAMARRDQPLQQLPLPTVVAMVQGNEEPKSMQLVAAEDGANVGTALAQIKRWFPPQVFTTSNLILRRPNVERDTWQELPIEWDVDAGQPTSETNHVLKPGDIVLICDRHVPASGPNMPSPSGQRPNVAAAVGPNGGYRPAKQSPANAAATDRYTKPSGVRPAGDFMFNSLTPAAAIVIAPNGPQKANPVDLITLQNGTTIASALDQVKVWPSQIDLNRDGIVIQRSKDGVDVEVLQVAWDRETKQPTKETNDELQAGDIVVVRPNSAAKSEGQPVPAILVQLNGGKGQAVPAAVMNDGQPVTVERALHSVAWPNPMSFSKALVTVHQRNGEGRIETERAVAWNGPHPTEETNYVLKPGDRVVVRTTPPGSAAAASSTPSPLPNPPSGAATPATATAASPTVPPVIAPDPLEGKSFVHYRAMILQDTSGSLSEFKPNKNDPGLSLGIDTSTVDAMMRILMNNKLITFMSRPQFIVAAGSPNKLQIASERADGQIDGIEAELELFEAKDKIVTRVRCIVKESGRMAQLETVVEAIDGKSAVFELARPELPPGTEAGDQTRFVDKPLYFILTPVKISRAAAASTAK